jgi:TP901 family phage tail tape measure protein
VWDLIARDGASAGFTKAGMSAERAGVQTEAASKKINGLGTSLLGVGVVLGAGEMIRSATKFQSSMLLIQTQAGGTAEQVKAMSGQVLKLAGPLGTAPEALATSLYHAFSVTKNLTQSLDIMKIAAEGAKVGHADLESTTNALTATVASGIPGITSMGQAMGVLNGIVGAGDMKMQDLNDAMGSGLLTVVKGYGLSITDVGAALATFGDNNIRGANAATMLRMAVQAMAVPAKAGSKLMGELGLTSEGSVAALAKLHLTTSTLARDMQTGGLNKAVLDLRDHLQSAGIQSDQVGQIITEAFGKKAGPGVAVLLGQVGRFENKLADVKVSGNQFGSAWAAWTKSSQGQTDQLKAGVEALGVSIGTKALPAVTGLVTFVNQHQGFVEGLVGGLVALKVGIAGVSAAQTLWAAGTAAVAAGVSGLETVYIAAMYAMDTAMGPVGLALAGLTGLIAIGTKGFGLFGSGAQHQVQAVQALTDAITQDGDAVGKLTAAQVNNTLQSKGAYDAGMKLGLSQEQVLAATMGNVDAQRAVAAAVTKAKNEYDNATKTVAVYGSSTKAGTTATRQATQAQKDANAAANSLAGSTGLVTAQLNASKHAADNVAIAAAGIPGGTDKAKAGFDRLRVAISKIPDHVGVNIDVNTAGAIAALQSFVNEASAAQAAAQIVGSVVYNTVQAPPNPHQAGHASGGYLGVGLSTVGEQGRETISWDGHSAPRVHSASDTARIDSGGGGNIYVTVNAGIGTDGAHAGRQIVSVLERWKGSGGRSSLFR